MGNWTTGTNIFKNYYYFPVYFQTRYNTGGIDFKIYENTTQSIIISYPSTAINPNSIIYLNYSGVKNVSVINESIFIKSSGMYSDLKDLTNNVFLATNFDTYYLSAKSNTRYQLGNFTDSVLCNNVNIEIYYLSDGCFMGTNRCIEQSITNPIICTSGGCV
jgi:hypothetical protein